MDSNILICSSLYEAARPYLNDFLNGLVKAAKNQGFNVLLACHGLENPNELLAPYRELIKIDTVDVDIKESPAFVRGVLFNQARKTAADYILFTDCDDILLPNAVKNHLETLDQADFSYADQILVDASGKQMGEMLYDDWNVPAAVTSPNDLLDGNFVGLSAVALRKEILTDSVVKFPDNIVACDWWLFTKLLLEGKQGKQSPSPGVEYRIHQAGIVPRIPQANKIEDILVRAKTAYYHYHSFPDWPEAVQRLEGVDLVIKNIDARPEMVLDISRTICTGPMPWYRDIAILADLLLEREIRSIN